VLDKYWGMGYSSDTRYIWDGRILAKLLKHLSLALALIISAGSGPLLRMSEQGDTNGDATIDVLDLQHVITEVLAGAAAPGHGDVNGDGRVDVLDFQTLLGQAQNATPAPGSAPSPNERGAAVNTRVSVDDALVRVVRVKSVTPEEGKSASSFGARPAFRHFVASTKVERHIQNLSPHAPPVLG
jgi:hypothetical protein